MTLALEKDAVALAGLTFRSEAFIDGRFVKSESGKTFSTENPGRGTTIVEIAECDAADVDKAVKTRARRSRAGRGRGWPPANRKGVLLRFDD